MQKLSLIKKLKKIRIENLYIYMTKKSVMLIKMLNYSKTWKKCIVQFHEKHS